MKRAFHFCAEYQNAPGQFHVFDGILTTEADPFDKQFHENVKMTICKSMVPIRPTDGTIIRSLTLLAESNV